MKSVFKSVIIILLFALSPIICYKSCSSFIYNQETCAQFNIDNIELRTGIDIPKITDVICDYKATEKTKVSVFTLNHLTLNFDYYITRNKFVKEGDFYVNRGERADTKWDARLNEENMKLTVSLVYK